MAESETSTKKPFGDIQGEEILSEIDSDDPSMPALEDYSIIEIQGSNKESGGLARIIGTLGSNNSSPDPSSNKQDEDCTPEQLRREDKFCLVSEDGISDIDVELRDPEKTESLTGEDSADSEVNESQEIRDEGISMTKEDQKQANFNQWRKSTKVGLISVPLSSIKDKSGSYLLVEKSNKDTRYDDFIVRRRNFTNQSINWTNKLPVFLLTQEGEIDTNKYKNQDKPFALLIAENEAVLRSSCSGSPSQRMVQRSTLRQFTAYPNAYYARLNHPFLTFPEESCWRGPAFWDVRSFAKHPCDLQEGATRGNIILLKSWNGEDTMEPARKRLGNVFPEYNIKVSEGIGVMNVCEDSCQAAILVTLFSCGWAAVKEEVELRLKFLSVINEPVFSATMRAHIRQGVAPVVSTQTRATVFSNTAKQGWKRGGAGDINDSCMETRQNRQLTNRTLLQVDRESEVGTWGNHTADGFPKLPKDDGSTTDHLGDFVQMIEDFRKSKLQQLKDRCKEHEMFMSKNPEAPIWSEESMEAARRGLEVELEKILGLDELLEILDDFQGKWSTLKLQSRSLISAKRLQFGDNLSQYGFTKEEQEVVKSGWKISQLQQAWLKLQKLAAKLTVRMEKVKLQCCGYWIFESVSPSETAIRANPALARIDELRDAMLGEVSRWKTETETIVIKEEELDDSAAAKRKFKLATRVEDAELDAISKKALRVLNGPKSQLRTRLIVALSKFLDEESYPVSDSIEGKDEDRRLNRKIQRTLTYFDRPSINSDGGGGASRRNAGLTAESGARAGSEQPKSDGDAGVQDECLLYGDSKFPNGELRNGKPSHISVHESWQSMCDSKSLLAETVMGCLSPLREEIRGFMQAERSSGHHKTGRMDGTARGNRDREVSQSVSLDAQPRVGKLGGRALTEQSQRLSSTNAGRKMGRNPGGTNYLPAYNQGLVAGNSRWNTGHKGKSSENVAEKTMGGVQHGEPGGRLPAGREDQGRTKSYFNRNYVAVSGSPYGAVRRNFGNVRQTNNARIFPQNGAPEGISEGDGLRAITFQSNAPRAYRTNGENRANASIYRTNGEDRASAGIQRDMEGVPRRQGSQRGAYSGKRRNATANGRGKQTSDVQAARQANGEAIAQIQATPTRLGHGSSRKFTAMVPDRIETSRDAETGFA